MSDRTPPFPGTNLHDWARKLFEYMTVQVATKTPVEPTPILLPHQQASQLDRAAIDGILMYNPVTQKVVVSIAGAWVPLN